MNASQMNQVGQNTMADGLLMLGGIENPSGVAVQIHRDGLFLASSNLVPTETGSAKSSNGKDYTIRVIARDDIMQWAPGKHGSTFGGNPVACAAAVATLDLVETELAANAARVGDRLLAGLRDLATRQPLIGDVRGRGLMIGFDVTDHDTAEALEQACFQRGLLVLTCGRKGIRLAPPGYLLGNDVFERFVSSRHSLYIVVEYAYQRTFPGTVSSDD